jgi:hypothetical protein
MIQKSTIVYPRKVSSMFPAMFTHKKIKYELIGVVMCLNDGQKEGSPGFHGRLCNFLPNALSRLEHIGQYGTQLTYGLKLIGIQLVQLAQ